MNKSECHFLGGPRDGQRIMLFHDGDYHDVSLHPVLNPHNWDPDAPADECMTVERFTYRRFRFSRDAAVFVPVQWFDQQQDLFQFVLKRLIRGYVGNTQP